MLCAKPKHNVNNCNVLFSFTSTVCGHYARARHWPANLYYSDPYNHRGESGEWVGHLTISFIGITLSVRYVCHVGCLGFVTGALCLH